MVALDLCDDVFIDEDASGLVIEDVIDWSGSLKDRPVLAVPADASNLVEKALALAEKTAGVRLVKRIPAGAGLGGGSADAAAVLRHFGATDIASAARLGADIPFCITGGRAVVTGIGDEIAPLPVNSEHVVVVTPGFGVGTREVYSAYDELGAAGWEGANDLEPAALSVEPRLSRVKSWISETTGREPTLAGSGGSFFFVCSESEQHHFADELAQALDDSIGPIVISRCRTGATSPS
jgi:4-diphosphocytidyl-2-C-methyl-D-erythritol kinase